MAEKYNATCSICGRPYYKCVSCKDTMALNPWKAFCCSSQHYKVHQVIRGFNGGVYTKDEARNKLNNINLFDIETFRPHIKQIVEDILKEDKISEEPMIENIVEDIVVETEEMAEKVDIEAPVYSRKKYYRMNDKVEEVETE